jgi:uncharacterized protein
LLIKKKLSKIKTWQKYMQQKILLKLLPSEAADEAIVKKYIASSAQKKLSAITGFKILKKSIDARGKTIFINLTVNAFIDEPVQQLSNSSFQFANVTSASKSVIIIGAGPAGIFAALMLLEEKMYEQEGETLLN